MSGGRTWRVAHGDVLAAAKRAFRKRYLGEKESALHFEKLLFQLSLDAAEFDLRLLTAGASCILDLTHVLEGPDQFRIRLRKGLDSWATATEPVCRAAAFFLRSSFVTSLTLWEASMAC